MQTNTLRLAWGVYFCMRSSSLCSKFKYNFFRQDVWACCQRNTIMTQWSRGELLSYFWFTVWTLNTKITALLSKFAFQFQSVLLQALSFRSEEEKHGACAPSQLKRPGGQHSEPSLSNKHIFRFSFFRPPSPSNTSKDKICWSTVRKEWDCLNISRSHWESFKSKWVGETEHLWDYHQIAWRKRCTNTWTTYWRTWWGSQ